MILGTAKRLLLGPAAGRYVKSAADLLPALVADLETAFASAVQEDGELLFLAEDERQSVNRWRHPRREAVWQAYLRRYLSLRIGRVFFGREPQVGVQEFPDVVAVPLGGTSATAEEVVIEVKLSDNSEVLTALDSQLARRYLNATTRRHGIYLVIFLDGATKSGSVTLKAKYTSDGIESYRKHLDAEAAQRAPAGTEIRAVVIDGRHPFATVRPLPAPAAKQPRKSKKKPAARRKPAAKGTKSRVVKKTKQRKR